MEQCKIKNHENKQLEWSKNMIQKNNIKYNYMLKNSQNKWPGILGEMQKYEDDSNLALFALVYGGTQIYITKNKNTSLLGTEANLYLKNYYAGCNIDIPLAKKKCAQILKIQGKSTAEIARLLHLNQRTIWRLVK